MPINRRFSTVRLGPCCLEGLDRLNRGLRIVARVGDLGEGIHRAVILGVGQRHRDAAENVDMHMGRRVGRFDSDGDDHQLGARHQ